MAASSFNENLDGPTLAGLRRGCRISQAQVYERFSRAAWTLALRLTGCEARAWDAVQDGFLAAFRRIRQFRGQAAFGYWLRRIIVNQVIDQHRAGRRETSLASAAPAITPDTDTRWLDLEKALDQLDPVDRLVIWLHDVEGMTHAEIAALDGHTESWSKSRLSRARNRLRMAVEPRREPNSTAAPARSRHG